MKKMYAILFLFNLQILFAQEQQVAWMNFEQLEDSLQRERKPVFIYFYSDWCVYCKKMERHAFRDPEVVQILNSNYYSVQMNANSRDSVLFDGTLFINEQAETQRNPFHQLPLLLANRESSAITLPALLLLDRDFRIRKRAFRYLTSEQLRTFLKK